MAALTEPLIERQLAAYLKAQGFGDVETDPGRAQRIFWGEIPPGPDVCIVILEEGGSRPLLTLAETRAFTIQTLNPEYAEGREEAQRIHRALQEQQGILSPTIMVARITADANPISLGRDPAGRHVFSQTFTMKLRALAPS